MSKFTDLIKEARKKTGLSQQSLANAIGMDRSNYVGVENGRKFLTKPQIKIISELSGMDFNVLYKAHEAWELEKKPKKADKLISEAMYLPTDKIAEFLATKFGVTRKEFFDLIEKKAKNRDLL